MKSETSKKRIIGLILSLFFCLFFLSGCWGKREVEDLAPLIGIGFDLGQKPGTYVITEQFAKPKKGGESGAEINDWTLSVKASSIGEAVEMTSKILNREPFLGSLKVMIIGEDAAKAGFNDIIDFAQRVSQFRRTMYLVIVKGKAQSILTMKLRSGELPAMFIKSNIETGPSISTFPTVRLGHYLTILGSKITAPIIPLVEKVESGNDGIQYETKGEEPEEIRIQGAGVLRGDHLVDLLTDEETKGYMWLDDDVEHRFINTADSGESEVKFVGRVLKAATKYKMFDNNGTMGIQYPIKARIAIDEVMGLQKQLKEAEWVDLMKVAEQSFAEKIEEESKLSLQKERELGLDFLGIGRHIEQKNNAYWKSVKDQWEERIADFPVSIDVQVTVDHSGMSGSSPMTN